MHSGRRRPAMTNHNEPVISQNDGGQLAKELSESPHPALPEIMITDRPLRDVADDTLMALRSMNDELIAGAGTSALFLRGDRIVRVRYDDEEGANIDPVDEAVLRGCLTRAANFYRCGRNSEWRHANPPLYVERDLLTRLDLGLPRLNGVTEAPVLRPDYSVLTVPGYDPDTHLLYAPTTDLAGLTVPDQPTAAEIAAAVELMRELLVDFPFVDEASTATAFAEMIKPLVRPAIAGPVPLHVNDAPMPGSGKGLLADVASVIATGRIAPKMPPTGSEEEWRKRITSSVLRGTRFAVIDNIEEPLDSAALASVLTTLTWEDRILGRSEMARIPHETLWIATGNNVVLRGDLPRRAVWCRQDAKVEHPWQRSDFRHPDLIAWASEHRGDLVAAVFTLARAWACAGCPGPVSGTPVLGSFERYRHVMGGILHVAGIHGFLANLNERYESDAEQLAEWQELFVLWWSKWGDTPVTVAEATGPGGVSLDVACAVLGDQRALAFEGSGSLSRRIGKALARTEDVIIGPYRLERAGKRHQAQLWRLRQMTEGS